MTDICGFLVFILVHTADIQDRDGAVDVLKAVRKRFPWLRHVFADGSYAGDKLRAALTGSGAWTIEIIKRSTRRRAFRFSLADGSSNAPSHGLADAAALPKTGRPPSHPSRHGRR
jgi:transposase